MQGPAQGMPAGQCRDEPGEECQIDRCRRRRKRSDGQEDLTETRAGGPPVQAPRTHPRTPFAQQRQGDGKVGGQHCGGEGDAVPPLPAHAAEKFQAPGCQSVGHQVEQFRPGGFGSVLRDGDGEQHADQFFALLSAPAARIGREGPCIGGLQGGG